MIKIFCDICHNEASDNDFIFEATKVEVITSLAGETMAVRKEPKKEMIQICKGCYYAHLNKLINDKEKK